jgi:hypothetical protein
MLARRSQSARPWILAGIGLVLFSLVTGPVSGQTTATWTGGAGTQNYSDPNNWSLAVVPLNNGPNTYNVVIPGTVTVRFDVDSSPQNPGTVTDFSLGAASTFFVNPGHAYVVLDDAQIAGIIQGDHGTFLAEAPGAAFTGNRGQAFALGAGHVAIAATSYASTGLLLASYTLFSADGAGTVLDLSSLQSINAGWNDNNGGAYVHTITATAGGLLDLSGVQTITAPYRTEDRLDVIAESGAIIDLSALQAAQSAGTGHARFVVGGAAMMLFGDLTVSGLMDVALTDITSVLDVAGNLLLDSGTFSVTAGAQVTVGKNFAFRYTTEANMDVQSGIVQLVGQAPEFLEVGGSDVGIPPGTGLNFGIGQLVVGADNVATVVQLMETIDNGNRNGSTPEALYLYGLGGPDGLRILGGSTLRLNALHCYAKLQAAWVLLNDLFPQGEVEIPFDNGFIRRDAGTQLVGDLNCDGTLNFDDIDPFVLALSDPDTSRRCSPTATGRWPTATATTPSISTTSALSWRC